MRGEKSNGDGLFYIINMAQLGGRCAAGLCGPLRASTGLCGLMSAIAGFCGHLRQFGHFLASAGITI
jgi:hypothetical protein